MINGFLFAFVFLIVINLLKKETITTYTLKKKQKKHSFLYILGDYNID